MRELEDDATRSMVVHIKKWFQSYQSVFMSQSVAECRRLSYIVVKYCRLTQDVVDGRRDRASVIMQERVYHVKPQPDRIIHNPGQKILQLNTNLDWC